MDVVIPAYNGGEIIHKCINSIKKNLPNSNIIVVDDYSTDATKEIIEMHHDSVLLFNNKSNKGFGQTCNEGVSKSNSEWVLLLNQDAQIKSLNSSKIEKIMADPRVAVIGGKVVDRDEEITYNIGKDVSLFRFLFHWPTMPLRFFGFNIGSLHVSDISNYSEQKSVPWITGSCWIIRKETFQMLGGFDKKFFLYVEELDYSRKVIEQEMKIVFDPSLVTYHEDRAGGDISSKSIYHTLRGQRIFIRSKFGIIPSMLFFISSSLSCILSGFLSFLPFMILGRVGSSMGLFIGGIKSIFFLK